MLDEAADLNTSPNRFREIYNKGLTQKDDSLLWVLFANPSIPSGILNNVIYGPPQWILSSPVDLGHVIALNPSLQVKGLVQLLSWNKYWLTQLVGGSPRLPDYIVQKRSVGDFVEQLSVARNPLN